MCSWNIEIISLEIFRKISIVDQRANKEIKEEEQKESDINNRIRQIIDR